jgi:dephospho-CoA kinase
VLRIGLTGGLASGKSTVAARLGELGATVFDADRIVAELYRPGRGGEAAARDLFGASVFDERGVLDRALLAQVVFTDPDKRRALEARVHPLVRSEIERRFAEAEQRGAAVAVAEVSQLLESGSEDRYDRVVLVVAPEEERIRRWVARGGAENDARGRVAAQLSPEAARRRATDVIINDGSIAELERRVDRLYREWVG